VISFLASVPAWFWGALDGNRLANFIGLGGLGVAVYVFIVEQQRNGREAKRQSAADAKKRADFIGVAQDTLRQAIRQIDLELPRQEAINPQNLADHRFIEHVCEPLAEVFKSLQQSAPFDGDLALTLSRGRRTLVELSKCSSRTDVMHVASFITFLKERRGDLDRRDRQLGTLVLEGSRLT